MTMYRAAPLLVFAVWLCASCALAVPGPEVCQTEVLINCQRDNICYFGGVCDSEFCTTRDPCSLDLLASDATYDARRLEVNGRWFDDDSDFPLVEEYSLAPGNITDGCRDLVTPFPINFYGTEYNEITICVEGFIQLGANTLYEDGTTDSTPDCPITDVAPRILVSHGDWELDYFVFGLGNRPGLEYWFMPLCQELREYGACIKVKWTAVQPETGDSDPDIDWNFYAWIYENGAITTIIEHGQDDSNNDLPTDGISMGLTSGNGDVLEVLCDDAFYDVIGNFRNNITQNGGRGFGVIYYPIAPFTPDPEEEVECLSPSSLPATMYCPGNDASLCLFGGDCVPDPVANKFDICQEGTTAALNDVADSLHYVARELSNATDVFVGHYDTYMPASTVLDLECGNIMLPFEFPFFNTLYTNMSFCSSGYIQFGEPSGFVDLTPSCPIPDEAPRILVGHSDWGTYSFKRGGSKRGGTGGVFVDSYIKCPLLPEYGKCVEILHKHFDPTRAAGLYASSFTILYENGAIISTFRFPEQHNVQPGNLTLGLTSGDGEVLEVLCHDNGDAHYSPLVHEQSSISLFYEPLWHNDYEVTTFEDSSSSKTTDLVFRVTLTCGTFFKSDQLVLTNAVLVSVTEVAQGEFDVVVDAIAFGVVTVGVRDTTLSVVVSASITIVDVVDGTIEVQNAQRGVGNTSFFGFTLNTPIVFHITFESPFDLTALELSASNGTIVGVVEGHSSSKKKKRIVNAPSLEWTVFVRPHCDGLVTLTYLPTGSTASANYIACLASLVSP